MAEVKWIKVTTSIFDDEKILLIESMPEADSIIVIWFKLLTLAGKLNDGGLLRMNQRMPYTDEMLATIFRRPLNTVRLALTTFESFGMIERIEDTFVISNWEKHQSEDKLEAMREQHRKRQKKYRDRQKQKLLDGEVTSRVTSRDAIEQDTEQEEEIDTDISSCSSGAATNIWKSLSEDEVNSLYGLYLNAGDLIQEVYEDVKTKNKVVNNAYRYICGYALKRGWQRNVN